MIKSAYIHIPFCRDICSYCDICKMYYNESLAGKYIKELKKEVLNNYKNEKLKTVYIGGGTPSVLNLEELKQLFEITNSFNLEEEYEFTIEVNPSDITEEFLELCKENKVNRISIGIETVNKKFFKFLNRYNTKLNVLRKVKLCKKYFNNINIDLMYGFYNQTMKDLKIDLDFFNRLKVNHISIYSLILERNTKLYIKQAIEMNPDLESYMYYYIIDYLKQLGYNHYEISNFSKDGYYSKHNLTYWNNENYYGFGLGASGYIGNRRYTNTRSINNYLKGKYVLGEEILDKNLIMEEELICGFRKIEGISISKFNEKFNEDIFKVFRVNDLIKQGLIKKKKDMLYIPKNKLYTSNSILMNFIIE